MSARVEQHDSTLFDATTRPGNDLGQISSTTNLEHDGQPSDTASLPTSFHPFFTLIEDMESGVHHHPDVHYIFSDDDPDNLTSLMIDGMHVQSQDANHHLLLLDVGTDGKSIEAAHSLSGHWQIELAELISAPSWTGTAPQTANERLMLKARGFTAKSQHGRTQSQTSDPVHQMEVDIEEYMNRLQHLQAIVGKGAML